MPRGKSSKTSSSFSENSDPTTSSYKSLEDIVGDKEDDVSADAGMDADAGEDAGNESDKKDKDAGETPDSEVKEVIIGVFYPPSSDPGLSSLQHLNISIDIINPGQSIAADAAIASENKLREAVASPDTNSAGQLLDTAARTDPQAEAAEAAESVADSSASDSVSDPSDSASTSDSTSAPVSDADEHSDAPADVSTSSAPLA